MAYTWRNYGENFDYLHPDLELLYGFWFTQRYGFPLHYLTARQIRPSAKNVDGSLWAVERNLGIDCFNRSCNPVTDLSRVVLNIPRTVDGMIVLLTIWKMILIHQIKSRIDAPFRATGFLNHIRVGNHFGIDIHFSSGKMEVVLCEVLIR